MIELSIVVLCYHSGKSILPFFDRLEILLENLHIEYEIILVANDFANSKDETIEIVKKLSQTHNRVKPILKIKEGMMGWDMQQGINACEGKYICVIDGDGQFPIESVQEVYFQIRMNTFDLVKTYRRKREDGIYRSFLSLAYNLFFNLLYPGLKSKDVNSKPKIFTREAYSKMTLKSKDWFIDAEMMIQVRKLNLRFTEIPITFKANVSRKSFVKPGAIVEFMANLIKYKFY